MNAKNIHLMDPKRARASIYRFWTACGETRSTRVVTTDISQVNCQNCLNSKIMRQAKEALATFADRPRFTHPPE